LEETPDLDLLWSFPIERRDRMGRMPLATPAQEAPSAPPVPRGVTDSPAKSFVERGTACLRQGRYDDARFFLRESLRFEPNNWVTLNNLGALALQIGETEEAETYYRRAFKTAPDNYLVVTSLAHLLAQECRTDEAAQLFRRALSLAPHSAEAWMNMGAILNDLTEFGEATKCMQESLRLEPDSHVILTNLGATFARQGRWDEALDCYDRALSRQPDYPEAHRNRAFALLACGDFERGWLEFEWRLKCRVHIGLKPSCPAWTGEDLQGKTILLHCELGLGDTIQLVRFVSEVRKRGAGKVIVICSKPLGRLIATCKGIDFVAVEGTRLPTFELHASLWSLPAILGITPANLPAPKAYLSADGETIARWRPALVRALGEKDMQDAIKVGIIWQGNRKLLTDRERSFRLEHLEPLARVPGVRMISLQKGYGVEQIDELGGRFPVTQLAFGSDGSEDRRDFLDTAAIMTQLDLVISPDSAAAHLAGSIGARVWMGLPAVAEWRWMFDREDSPWYPTMRLFRQMAPRDWPGVFERMAQALADSREDFARSRQCDS
jgi:Flp pilus assembly protein TadD